MSYMNLVSFAIMDQVKNYRSDEPHSAQLRICVTGSTKWAKFFRNVWYIILNLVSKLV